VSKIKRIITFFVFVGLFSLSYQIGSMSEVSKADALEIKEEFEELFEGIDAIGIFLHNLSISIAMFIPGFGIGWGFFVAWSTGYAFAAIVSITPALSDVPALALLYASPFGLMELTAYSIATSRSFILIHMIIRKTGLYLAIKSTVIEIGIAIGLLIAGGFLEDYMIKLSQETGFKIMGF